MIHIMAMTKSSALLMLRSNSFIPSKTYPFSSFVMYKGYISIALFTIITYPLAFYYMIT